MNSWSDVAFRFVSIRRSPKQVTCEFRAFLRACITLNRPALREKEGYTITALHVDLPM